MKKQEEKDPWDVCEKCHNVYDTRSHSDGLHGCNPSFDKTTQSVDINAPIINKADYFAFHQDFCRRMIDITAAKNADYTGNSDDPFANFTLVETFGAMTTEQGFFARMTDKFARVSSFIQNGELQVKTETVEDTLLDLANYCALLAGYLNTKKKG